MKQQIKRAGNKRIKNSGTGDIPMQSVWADSFIKETNEIVKIDSKESCIILGGKDPELIESYVRLCFEHGGESNDIEDNLTIVARPIDSRRVDKVLKRHHNMINVEKVKKINYNSNRVMIEQLFSEITREN